MIPKKMITSMLVLFTKNIFFRKYYSHRIRRALARYRFLRSSLSNPYRRRCFIRIDASTLCQLACRGCKIVRCGTERPDVVGQGFLRFDDFKRFLDAHPKIENVELSNNGEIFLNPELMRIIRYAAVKNVKLTAVNGVNLNAVSDQLLEEMVKCRFYKMTVSLDGTDQNTYARYRRGGDYEAGIRNIKKINFYKEMYGVREPFLTWQFIIFGHNEHQIPAARQKAKELGMEFRLKLPFRSSMSPVKNKDFVRRETGLGVATREEFAQRYGKSYSLPCIGLWLSPQVNWDGKLLGCCPNTAVSFGNVFEDGLVRGLRNPHYRRMKKILLGLALPEASVPCFHCRRFRALSGFWARFFMFVIKLKKIKIFYCA